METHKIQLYRALTVLVLFGAVFAGTRIITEIKGYRFIGGGVSATNTISISGEGEVFAVPDIATISFSIREESKKVSDAQNKVSAKIKTTLTAVRKLGVPDKDIKTQNYNSYPKYEWQNGSVSCMGLNCPPPYPGKQVLSGYEVSQSVVITVRNLDLVNGLIDALGTAGVTDMNGPNFAIDKQDELIAHARKEAIDKARTKAEVLARDLGVSLVRVVSFSEGQNYPIYARVMMAEGVGVATKDANTPELPQGEEKIIFNVTITYEIR